ncbi:beta-mannosidase-like [Trichoplusia ni]|uniref:Beta-mannosidase n=1 Tax=Trichoplusia ni TaxID=7111 RepID=A0A7E5WQM9_TRINI|nr:beta-mannosidase-like [Trichoplusia ni]
MRTFVLLCSVLTIINAEIIDLSSSDNVIWTFVSKNGSMKGPATVPGGVYSDLQKAGIIGDILNRDNDVLTRWVAFDTWTYTAKFQVSIDDLASRVVHLVFDGLDTTAFIVLNDHSPIGAVNNMFVKYVFDIKNKLKAGENVLNVTFLSPIMAAQIRSSRAFAAPACVPPGYNGECHVNQLRKMQASFAWDWGPAFPSVGIWKPVYIEKYDGAVIRWVTTHTKRVGVDWSLTVQAHIETSKKVTKIDGVLSIALQVEGKQMLKKWKQVNVETKADGTVVEEIELLISGNMIRLWWPNGYGEPTLYDLHVHYTTASKKEESRKDIKIGFRTVEIVESPASEKLGNTTAGKGLTFYFKVNGYPLFMKGSNWIPSNILPELGESDKATIDNLLTAAYDVNMAMLRVWGGGVYESDYFYEKCDQLGILIWQDFMFACSMYPVDPPFLNVVTQEIEQNVLRLQHHPSIAVWAGNNENEVALRGNWYGTSKDFKKYEAEYIKLYVDTIRPIVETLDPERRYLVSSPSNGIESEREGYIASNPYDPHYGDTHYYNYFADNWNMNTYPKTRFASEYGFQSLPSIRTLKTATSNPDDLKLNSKFSEHRQHSPNGYSYIENQLTGHMKLDVNDFKYFEKFVFYSQISQAMALKTETEVYRQGQADWYTMGALYWQLNDVWQAPSWSGIEYGGRWKMLHYFAKTFFAPVLVSPRQLVSDDIDVYLLNDRFVPIIDAVITVDIYNWTSLTPINTKQFPGDADALSAKLQDIDMNYWDYKKEQIFLRFSLDAPGVKSSPNNYVFPVPLKSIVGLIKPNITITVANIVMRRKEKLEYTVNIEVDTIVLFLWLETGIKGNFIDNAFIVTEPTITAKFVCSKYVAPRDLQSSIEIQYYVN